MLDKLASYGTGLRDYGWSLLYYGVISLDPLAYKMVLENSKVEWVRRHEMKRKVISRLVAIRTQQPRYMKK